MLQRPEAFSEVVGQASIVRYLDSRIQNNSLPQFIIFAGEEGLGKTTLAKICAVLLACKDHCGKCEKCLENTEQVIRRNKSTNSIKSFAMSEEGGKEAAKDLLLNYNANFLDAGARVLIADEVQNMTKQAYDALLNDTEYPPQNVYLFMCTTDLEAIPKTLRSRATILRLSRLTNVEMKELLTNYALRNNQVIENSEVTISIISTYAENKPRTALRVLEAIGEGKRVTLQEVKEYVQFEEPTTFLPIVEALQSSLLDGVSHCLSIDVRGSTQYQMCDFLQECIRSHRGETVVKYDFRQIRSVLLKVKLEVLVLLLYNIANIENFNQSSLLAAYLRTHPGFAKLRDLDPEILRIEKHKQMANAPKQEIKTSVVGTAPSMDELLRQSKRLVD